MINEYAILQAMIQYDKATSPASLAGKVSESQNTNKVAHREEEEAPKRALFASLRLALASYTPAQIKKTPEEVQRDNALVLEALAVDSESHRFVMGFLRSRVRRIVEKSLTRTVSAASIVKQVSKAREKSANEWELNDLLSHSARNSATSLCRVTTDSLQDIDVQDLAENALLDALVDLYDSEVEKDLETRTVSAVVCAFAYNGIRRYLRRTRFDTKFDSSVTAEVERSLYSLSQEAYESEVESPAVKLAGILAQAKKAFFKTHKLSQAGGLKLDGTPTKASKEAKAHNAKLFSRLAGIEGVIINEYCETRPSRKTSSEYTREARDKDAIRQIFASRAHMWEAINE
ncbi:MAG: hypothetical protein ACYC63_04690 [Armatimonadota bacterium]